MIFSLIAREGHPSIATAALGVVITAAFTITHTSLYLRYRTWFLYLLVFSAILQTIGFSTRLAWILHQNHNGPLYASYLVMMVTPSLTLAACHMTFGRILSYTRVSNQQDSSTLFVPTRLIMPMFVGLDVIALCIQLLGGSLTCAAYINSSDPTSPNMSILTIGLQVSKWTSVVQIISLGVFTLFTARLLWLGSFWHRSSENLDFFVGALASVTSISSTLIMLQEINSVIELDSALHSLATYSATHEWVFWVTDALPVFLVFLGLAVVYPGRCLPSDFTRFHLRNTTGVEMPQFDSSGVNSVHTVPLKGDGLSKSPSIRPPGTYSYSSNKSQRFQRLGDVGTERLAPDVQIFGPGNIRGYHEVNPYESEKSYRAYVHGAL